MRKLGMLVIAAVLAFATVTVSAAPPPDGPPGLERAIAAQEAHNPRLLNTPGVAGTAVSLQANGKAAVIIFVEHGAMAGLPDLLDGVPVAVEVTGKFIALKAPPSAGSKLSTTSVWPRPVPIGISTGNANEVSAGTIAARVKDASGNVYALSNNHVYARENSAALGEEVLQPGLYDTGGVYNPANHLGNLSSFVSLNYSGAPNYVDAAIASTSAALLDKTTPTSLGGYGVPGSTTTAATVGMAVKKFGRTTRLTTGTVSAINASVSVSYEQGTALFVDQIIVRSNKPFIKAGDSGSLLVRNNTGANPVGLLFAGNANGTFAVANRIDLVLGGFGITIDGK
ncbi:MAG: hypothetical protein Q7R57_08095 [Dehalococcoidales bacterium]|nr:hypothetical protein [Dehalococcoidales bacterium]